MENSIRFINIFFRHWTTDSARLFFPPKKINKLSCVITSAYCFEVRSELWKKVFKENTITLLRWGYWINESLGNPRCLEVMGKNTRAEATKQKKSFRNLHRVPLGYLLNTLTCTHRMKLSELRKRAIEPWANLLRIHTGLRIVWVPTSQIGDFSLAKQSTQ